MVLSHARNLSRQLRVSEEKCLMSFARFQHRKSLWGAQAAFWSRQLAETGQSVRSLEIAMQMCCRQGCRQLQAGSLRCQIKRAVLTHNCSSQRLKSSLIGSVQTKPRSSQLTVISRKQGLKPRPIRWSNAC